MSPANRALLKEKFIKEWSYGFGTKCGKCKTVICCKCADICFKCYKLVCKEHYKTVQYKETEN